MRTSKQMLWWVFSGTKGGYNRALIIIELLKDPLNAHQLSQNLNLDYKTVRHHLSVLEKNRIIESIGSGYGNCYFLKEMDDNEMHSLSNIFNKMGLEVKNE